MNARQFSGQQQDKPYDSRRLLKDTALLDLREALAREEYERCAELVALARDYGARRAEIRRVLAYSVRGKATVRRDRRPVKPTVPRFKS